MDNVARIQALMAAAGRLIRLIEQENEHLAAMQPQRIAETLDEKAGLTRTYAALSRDIKADPALLAALGQAVRAELADVLKRFDQAVTANEHHLKAMRIANERVMKAIVDAHAAQQAVTAGYSSTGGPPAPARSAQAAPRSIAVDRRL
jgi:ABC-type transporter Mla subunit MlaD